MNNVIRRKAGILDLIAIQILCQLMHNRTNHLQVSQIFWTDRREEKTPT